ncbi:MAG TPA: phosphatidate cytidylyltransferase [Micromonosporaceae bacterium]|nr:phosphatidate cytidylyltransferase [Micromonosporaceae bacterium]
MSHPDPYGGAGPRGRGRQRDPDYRGRSDSNNDIRVRARHASAAPDAYLRHADGGPASMDHAHSDEFEPLDSHRGSWQSEPEPEPEEIKSRRRGPGRRRAGKRRASRKARAGRNLPAAIGVGLGLAAIILIPLFTYRPAFIAVIAAAVSIGIWEMVRAVRAIGARAPMLPLLAGGLLMTGLVWQAGLDGLSFGLLVTVVAVVVWRLADGPGGYQRDVIAAALIAVYVPFLAGFAALLSLPSDGHWRVLVTLAAVVLSDTGGYVVGVFFGKHPMAPSVSPKKSWEGFAGSVGSSAIGSALLLNVALDVDFWWGALFGLAVSVAAVLGDLCESMIKRDLGIKDMSQLLPGHGGLMDRLDSILFAVPTAYLMLAIIAPAG